jgi:hypothetical protein
MLMLTSLFYEEEDRHSLGVLAAARFITPASKYFFSNLKNVNLPE